MSNFGRPPRYQNDLNRRRGSFNAGGRRQGQSSFVGGESQTAASVFGGHEAPVMTKEEFLERRKREKDWMLDTKVNFSNTPLIDIPSNVDTIPLVIQLLEVHGFERPNIRKEDFKKIYMTYNVTLFHHESKKFFGRTYSSRPLALQDNLNGVKNKEYLFIHTTRDTAELIDVCLEAYITLVPKSGYDEQYHSVGFTLFKLLTTDIDKRNAKIWKGSPRQLVMKQEFSVDKTKKENGTLVFKVADYKNWIPMRHLVPPNTLCGMSDEIPGLTSGKLSLQRDTLKFCPTTDISLYPVNIEMSPQLNNIKVKDNIYHTDAEDVQSAYQDMIVEERRLVVDWHNTWRTSGKPSIHTFAEPDRSSMKSKIKGYFYLNDFTIHPKTALYFKVEVGMRKRTDMAKLTGGRAKQEPLTYFTLGWGIFCPKITIDGRLLEEKVEIDCKIGPGITPDGDVLLNPAYMNREDQYLKIQFDLATKEPENAHFAGDDVKRAVGDADTNQLQKPGRKLSHQSHSVLGPKHGTGQEFSDNGYGAGQPYQGKSRQVQELEDRLSKAEQKIKEKERYIRGQEESLTTHAIQALNKDNQRNNIDREDQYHMIKDIEEKFKNISRHEREEAERIIQDIKEENKKLKRELDSQQRHPSHTYHPNVVPIPAEHQYNAMPGTMYPGQYPPGAQTSKRIGTAKRLIDDKDVEVIPPPPQVPLQMPGTYDINTDDEIAFVKLGISNQIMISDRIDEQPRMETEKADVLNACDFEIKFIAFKPPMTLPQGSVVPRRFYFTFQLFTHPNVKTEIAEIKQDTGLSTDQEALIPGQQYLLERLVSKSDKITNDLSSIVEQKFNIDPSMSKIKNENIEFARYLLERELSINIYDADSMLQYGQCRIPLVEMLRQGRSSVIRAKDCEIASFENGEKSITGAVKMGSLQVLVSHIGKPQSIKEVDYDKDLPADLFEGDRKQPSQKHKYKKKIRSKPINMMDEEQVLAKTKHQENATETVLSKEARQPNPETRKKMRVEKLK